MLTLTLVLFYFVTMRACRMKYLRMCKCGYGPQWPDSFTRRQCNRAQFGTTLVAFVRQLCDYRDMKLLLCIFLFGKLMCTYYCCYTQTAELKMCITIYNQIIKRAWYKHIIASFNYPTLLQYTALFLNYSILYYIYLK